MSKEKELGPMGPLGALRRLEVDPDTYNELDRNLRTAASVAGAVKEILPPHLALRLEGAIAKCQGAIGRFTITRDVDLLKVEDLVRRLDIALLDAMDRPETVGLSQLEAIHQEALQFLFRLEPQGSRIRIVHVTPTGFHYEVHPVPLSTAVPARGYRI
jgi:hypothetical protein